MSNKHESRPYQDEMESAVMDYLLNKEGNPLVACPGGCGKSHVMNRICKRLLTEYPGTRVMLLAMDAKLLRQGKAELLRYWPKAPVGTYSAGLKMKDTAQPIIYAGIQSVAKRASEFGEINILIIDECDQLSPNENTLYQKFIAELRETNPFLRVVGFTATCFRMGLGCLTNADIWDEICIDLTKTERFNYFVDEGYLKPLITKKTAHEVDVTNIAMKGGEFDQHELQEASDTDTLNRAVIEECVKFGADRQRWLCFSSGVKHGNNLTKLFNARGIPAVMLTGADTVEYRTETEAAWRSGRFRVLVNCGLYSRGFDQPDIDLIAVVRATQSTAWWIQTCLRGTRRAEGVENCLVLDFCGNIRRNGPVNDPIIPSPRRKGQAVAGEAPLKVCPVCFSYRPIQEKICGDCGNPFPPPKTIEKTASSAEIMVRSKTKDTNPVIEEFFVVGIRYKPTVSKKGTHYLRVTYSVGTASFHEPLFFDHATGPTKRKLTNWWTFRGGLLPIPDGVEEAADRASNELSVPSIVRVDMNTKYKEVVGADFDSDERVLKEIEDDDIPF